MQHLLLLLPLGFGDDCSSRCLKQLLLLLPQLLLLGRSQVHRPT